MKAVTYREYGTPDVLQVEDIPVPVPGTGEVLVRVQASSINDYDWHLLTGRPWINRMGGLRSPVHLVLGSDVAGVVDAVGPGVTRWQPGDAVFGDVSTCGFGAFAEYVVAPEAAMAARPSALSVEQAAAVPQAGGLAVTGVRRRVPITPDHRVLVNGAGGGVGTFAVQIAKAFGAHVTGVDTAAKLDVVRAAGADVLIDYTQTDVTTLDETYDLILDVTAYRSIGTYRRMLRPGGICSVIGGPIPKVMLLLAVGRATSLIGDRTVEVPTWRPNDPADVGFLTRLLEAGTVAPVVDSVYPLAEVPEAFRRFAAQQHAGKIVISV